MSTSNYDFATVYHIPKELAGGCKSSGETVECRLPRNTWTKLERIESAPKASRHSASAMLHLEDTAVAAH